MFQLVFTNKFNKDVKLLQKRGYNMELFKNAILLLEATGNLPSAYNPHKLAGNSHQCNFSQTENDYLAISFADLRFHAATKNQIVNA